MPLNPDPQTQETSSRKGAKRLIRDPEPAPDLIRGDRNAPRGSRTLPPRQVPCVQDLPCGSSGKTDGERMPLNPDPQTQETSSRKDAERLIRDPEPAPDLIWGDRNALRGSRTVPPRQVPWVPDLPCGSSGKTDGGRMPLNPDPQTQRNVIPERRGAAYPGPRACPGLDPGGQERTSRFANFAASPGPLRPGSPLRVGREDGWGANGVKSSGPPHSLWLQRPVSP
jgi:hypothetical protein